MGKAEVQHGDEKVMIPKVEEELETSAFKAMEKVANFQKLCGGVSSVLPRAK